MRSFRVNGLGPRDGGMCFIPRKGKTGHANENPNLDDSVGGDLYYSAGVSVVSDIPTRPHWPVKTHAWINAGRLEGLDQCKFISGVIPSCPHLRLFLI